MEEILKRLCQAMGVSGDEGKVAKILENELAPYVDRTWRDNLGNLIFERVGSEGARKVLIVAHMDEIGGMIKHVDKEGFLYFVDIGSHDPSQLLGNRVVVGDSTIGVVQKGKKGDDLKIDDLYIDIGATGIDDVKAQGIGPGSLFTRAPSYGRLLGSRRVSKSFDNRAGICVMAETLKRLTETNCSIMAVASCQEEVGVRGSKVLSNYVEADFAFALDVTFAVDTPQRSSPRDVNTYLGKGPAITLKDDQYIMSSDVKEFIENVARDRGIPLQYDISKGGTDAGPLYISKGANRTAPILVPLRYMHTGSEILDLGDVNETVKLLIALIEELDKYEPDQDQGLLQ